MIIALSDECNQPLAWLQFYWRRLFHSVDWAPESILLQYMNELHSILLCRLSRSDPDGVLRLWAGCVWCAAGFRASTVCRGGQPGGRGQPGWHSEAAGCLHRPAAPQHTPGWWTWSAHTPAVIHLQSPPPLSFCLSSSHPPPLPPLVSVCYSNTEQASVYLTRSSPLSLYQSIQYSSRTIYLCWHYLTDAVRSVHWAGPWAWFFCD